MTLGREGTRNCAVVKRKSQILMIVRERRSLAWHLCASTFLMAACCMWSRKSVGLYVCLLESYNVAAVNKWVVLYLFKLALILLCAVCARSFFPGSQLRLRQRRLEVFMHFSLPRFWKLKMSCHWPKPHESWEFQSIFLPHFTAESGM